MSRPNRRQQQPPSLCVLAASEGRGYMCVGMRKQVPAFEWVSITQCNLETKVWSTSSKSLRKSVMLLNGIYILCQWVTRWKVYVLWLLYTYYCHSFSHSLLDLHLGHLYIFFTIYFHFHFSLGCIYFMQFHCCMKRFFYLSNLRILRLALWPF